MPFVLTDSALALGEAPCRVRVPQRRPPDADGHVDAGSG